MVSANQINRKSRRPRRRTSFAALVAVLGLLGCQQALMAAPAGAVIDEDNGCFELDFVELCEEPSGGAGSEGGGGFGESIPPGEVIVINDPPDSQPVQLDQAAPCKTRPGFVCLPQCTRATPQYCGGSAPGRKGAGGKPNKDALRNLFNAWKKCRQADAAIVKYTKQLNAERARLDKAGRWTDEEDARLLKWWHSKIDRWASIWDNGPCNEIERQVI